MRTIVKAMVTGAALLLSGGVMAADDEAMAANDQDMGLTFEALDADKDGQISVEEAKQSPALESVFTSADADQDERLSESEFNIAAKLLGG